MKRPGTTLTGLLVGGLFPVLLMLPAALAGRLGPVLSSHRVYFLLPASTLLLVPGYLIGRMGAPWWNERRTAWQFGAGLFFGGTLAGALLVWAGTSEMDLVRRFVLSLFGGALLGGFWIWLGHLMGAAAGMARLERPSSASESTISRWASARAKP